MKKTLASSAQISWGQYKSTYQAKLTILMTYTTSPKITICTPNEVIIKERSNNQTELTMVHPLILNPSARKAKFECVLSNWYKSKQTIITKLAKNETTHYKLTKKKKE